MQRQMRTRSLARLREISRLLVRSLYPPAKGAALSGSPSPISRRRRLGLLGANWRCHDDASAIFPHRRRNRTASTIGPTFMRGMSGPFWQTNGHRGFVSETLPLSDMLDRQVPAVESVLKRAGAASRSIAVRAGMPADCNPALPAASSSTSLWPGSAARLEPPELSGKSVG